LDLDTIGGFLFVAVPDLLPQGVSGNTTTRRIAAMEIDDTQYMVWLILSFGAGWMLGAICERLWGNNEYR